MLRIAKDEGIPTINLGEVEFAATTGEAILERALLTVSVLMIRATIASARAAPSPAAMKALIKIT